METNQCLGRISVVRTTMAPISMSLGSMKPLMRLRNNSFKYLFRHSISQEVYGWLNMYNIELARKKKKEIRSLLDTSKVSTHGDADGLASLALIHSFSPIKTASVPYIFGHIDGDETLILDQIPRISVIKTRPEETLVIDHHPIEAHIQQELYILLHDIVPTSLIVYEVFKEEIPEDEKWKVAVGLVGDQAPYLIPNEIWESFNLLDELVSIGRGDYSKRIWQASNPLWFSLSNINYLCRLGTDFALQAIKKLIRADNPLSLITDQDILEARDTIIKETNRVIRGQQRILDLGPLRVMIFESAYAIEGLLCSQLQSLDRKTLIVINSLNKKFSGRGVLARYLVSKLKDKYEIGGHPQALGGILKRKQRIEEFIEDLREISRLLR